MGALAYLGPDLINHGVVNSDWEREKRLKGQRSTAVASFTILTITALVRMANIMNDYEVQSSTADMHFVTISML